jgi:hypothetical protein
LVYIGGYHLIYSLYQQGLKTEMKAFLKENNSSSFGSRLVFTLSGNQIMDPDFSWEEENKEFRYQQEFYDVVSIEKKDGKMILICLKDNEENNLENQLNEIHKFNKAGHAKSTQNNNRYFSVFYLEKQQKFFFDSCEKGEIIAYNSSCLLDNVLDILQPPPRC